RVAEGFDDMYRSALGTRRAPAVDELALRRTAKKRRAEFTTEPLRVALLNHSGRMGGGEFSMLRLAEALDPGRIAITVIAGEDGPFVQRLHELGANVVVVPMDPRLVNRRKDTLGVGGLVDLDLWRQFASAVWP